MELGGSWRYELEFLLKQSRLYDGGKQEPAKEFQRDTVRRIKLLDWLFVFIYQQSRKLGFMLTHRDRRTRQVTSEKHLKKKMEAGYRPTMGKRL